MAQPQPRIAYKVNEVAARLGMSPKWVRANAIKLGGVKITGTWLFPPEGLDHAFTPKHKRPQGLEGQRKGQGEAPPKELQEQKGSPRLGTGQEGGNDGTSKEPNRHGLLGGV